jgi:hypothetical protein
MQESEGEPERWSRGGMELEHRRRRARDLRMTNESCFWRLGAGETERRLENSEVEVGRSAVAALRPNVLAER